MTQPDYGATPPAPQEKPRTSVNSGLFTWAVALVAAGVLLVVQALVIHMEFGVFLAVLFASVGVALIASALMQPKKPKR